MPRKPSKREKQLFDAMGLSNVDLSELQISDIMSRLAKISGEGEAENEANFFAVEAIREQQEGEDCFLTLQSNCNTRHGLAPPWISSVCLDIHAPDSLQAKRTMLPAFSNNYQSTG
jgi:hypothetical protein